LLKKARLISPSFVLNIKGRSLHPVRNLPFPKKTLSGGLDKVPGGGYIIMVEKKGA
jgi:hypothetical protein